MSDNTLLILATVATVFGTVGGALEKLCSPESFWYRLGVILASLGVDLTSLGKLSGRVAVKDATSAQINAVERAASKLPPLACIALLGCSGQTPQLTALQQTEVLSYGQQEIACVTDSQSRPQADACIAGVKAQWCSPGAPLQQQGACGDAGPEASTPLGPTLNALLDKVLPRDAGKE